MASRIRWTGKPGVLQSAGLVRVGHNLVTEQEQHSRLVPGAGILHIECSTFHSIIFQDLE